MNVEKNGKDLPDDEVELTDLALGQLDAERSRAVEKRIAADKMARRSVRETELVASAIRQANEHQLPTPIEGLQSAIENAFGGGGAELDDASKSSDNKVKPAAINPSSFFSKRWLHWSVVAGLVAVLGSLGYVLTSSNPSTNRPMVQQDTWSGNRADTAEGNRWEESDESSTDDMSLRAGVEFETSAVPASENIEEKLGMYSQSQKSGQGSGSFTGNTESEVDAERPRMAEIQFADSTKRTPIPADESIKLEQLAQNATAEPASSLPSTRIELRNDNRGFGGGGGEFSPDPQPTSDARSRGGRGEGEMSENTKFFLKDVDGDTYGRDDGRFRQPDRRMRIDRSGEQYEALPENPFLPVAGENRWSTFSIDVDTASYANVRRFIRNRQLPPPAAVRIEEMINYFDYNYPQPDGAAPFSVNLEVAGCPWNPDHKLLRVGLKGKEIHRKERPLSNLVFLIDVSGSMSSADKLPLLKSAMLMLVDELGENDRVSIVTYAGNAGVRLEPTTGDQKDTIRNVINGLSAGGSTHGSAGIQLAYDKAAQHFISEGVNRVILATDGDLNVGITDDNALVQLIKDRARTGVFLSVLGFGTGNLKDAKLEKLADNGNGNYAYIDSTREAQKVLVKEMSGSLVTIAKDVKIQLEFNPLEVRAYRLIGYENRVLANQDFENDAVDAGDIGAGHTVTALYELVPVEVEERIDSAATRQSRYARPVEDEPEPKTEPSDEARSGELVYLKLRYKKPDAEVSELVEEFTIEDQEVTFEEASDDFRFATSVAAFGMVLRHSRYADHFDLEKIHQTAAGALGENPSVNRAEFVDLIRELMHFAR